MASSAGNDLLLVHRCRFVQNQPSSISALALNESETQLAVSRENSSIELWNLEHNYYQQRVRLRVHLRSLGNALELHAERVWRAFFVVLICAWSKAVSFA